MNWDLIFTIASNGVMLFWLLLAFAPRTELVMKIVFYGGAGLLSLTYALIIIPLMTGVIDGGGSGAQPNLFTLDGVQELLSSDGGATIGWIHYLAFDLFVGIWVARNADRYGFNRIIQIPFLFFTLMLGPLGLTLYLLVRSTRHDRVADGVIPQ